MAENEQQGNNAPPTPPPKKNSKNPFKSGFVPNGRRKAKGQSFITKRSLLKIMLEVEITAKDLPTALADRIRAKLPGFIEDIDRKFTLRQIMELCQMQLLFSNSDYVVQDAINAIKDRIDGKAVQKIQMEQVESEPTEIKLPNGRVIVI